MRDNVKLTLRVLFVSRLPSPLCFTDVLLCVYTLRLQSVAFTWSVYRVCPPRLAPVSIVVCRLHTQGMTLGLRHIIASFYGAGYWKPGTFMRINSQFTYGVNVNMNVHTTFEDEFDHARGRSVQRGNRARPRQGT